jgi:hypothetical protein
MDKNDKLLVMRVTGDGWASFNLSDSVVEWMKDNI